MQVFINSPTTNHSLKLECDPDDLVSKLKSFIEAKENISHSKQFLTYQCKPLKDSARLGEYGIKENSTIFLDFKLTAGSGKITPQGNKETNSQKYKEKKQEKGTYDVENIVKYKELYLPEEFQNIAQLQSLYKDKVKDKKDKHKWNLLTSHENQITSVAISTDDRFIVTGSKDLSIKVFDLENNQEYHHFKNVHKERINSVAFSIDNSLIVSCSNDKSIKLFDFETKEEYHHFQDVHTDEVTAVAASGDSRFVFSGSLDCSIKMFDLKSKKEHYHFKDMHSNGVTTIALSQNGQFIVSGSRDSSIKIIDIQTKQEYHCFDNAHYGWINSVAISKDNRFVVSGSRDYSVKVFDLQTKQEYHHFNKAHQSWVGSVAISPDNRLIISGSGEGSINIFDIQAKEEYYSFKAKSEVNENYEDEENVSVAISNDGKFIISGGYDNTLKIFYLQTKPEEQQHFEDIHDSEVYSIAVSKDNKLMVLGCRDWSIKVFDLETKEDYHHFEIAHNGEVLSVALSNDNRFIISGSDDNSIKIFDLNTKTEYHHFEEAHKNWVNSVAISSDDKFIVSGSQDNSVKVFDLEKKEEHHHFKDAHTSAVLSVAITTDSRFIVSGSGDCSVKVFDLNAKQEYYHFKNAHAASIISVAISKNNKYIVSGSQDHSIKVFDLQRKQERHHFKTAHSDEVTSIAISNDNRFIVSGSQDRSIKIFDLETKQEHYHFKDIHEDWVKSVAVSNDNKYIFSADLGRSAKMTRIPETDNVEVFYISDKLPLNSTLSIFDDLLFTVKTPEYFRRFITFYQDLYVSPHYWTLLHLACIFQKPSHIAQIPSYTDFKVPFLLDRYGKTPLHYLVSQENIHYASTDVILDYILDYIEDKSMRAPYELEQIFKSLSSLFSFILSKSKSKIRDRYLKAAFMSSYCSEELPLFASPEPSSVFSQTSVINPETKTRILKEGNEQVRFRSMMLYVDYHPARDDMYLVALTLLHLRNEDIFKSPLVGHLIDQLWKDSYKITRGLALIFWLYMILISVYMGIGERMLVMEPIIAGLAVGLLYMEVIQMSGLRTKYFKVIWNWMDLGQLGLTIAFFFPKVIQEDLQDTLTIQWMSTFILLLGYVRWVSYLRLFKPTRNLIQVIISIIQDMAGFVLILVFIIVGFSLIFLQFNRDNEYPIHLNNSYQVLYGSYDTTGASLSEKLLAAFILFLLNVVLLNLLISIMSDSYDKVQERRLLTDSVTRLEMIIETLTFIRVFLPRYDRELRKGFMIYCLPENEEEEKSTDGEWEGRINMIRKLLKQNEQKVEEVKDLSTGIAKSIEDKIDNNKNDMEKRMEVMEKEMRQVKQMVQEIHRAISHKK